MHRVLWGRSIPKLRMESRSERATGDFLYQWRVKPKPRGRQFTAHLDQQTITNLKKEIEAFEANRQTLLALVEEQSSLITKLQDRVELYERAIDRLRGPVPRVVAIGA
jgi:predicted RNase H-like nuclease (RuvC/YqgF family)